MTNLPSLSQFSQITANIAAEDGIEDYLPTYAVNGEIRVIEGIPSHVDDGVALQNALGDLDADEFLFGVRSGAAEITTGHISRSDSSFMQISLANGVCTIQEAGRPEWWQHGL